MTPDDLAALHWRCFPDNRAWSAAEFRDLLGNETTVLIHVRHGFVLGRIVGGEAEILTLAVAPEHRNRGTGSCLIEKFKKAAASASAGRVVLEVATDNDEARSLYQKTGFRAAAIRKDYYKALPHKEKVSALVMTCDIEPDRG